jgi:ferritin-like metal-binding protein YciE
MRHFAAHLRWTRNHLRRLGRLMKTAAQAPVAESCRAIRKLNAEEEETLRMQSELLGQFMGCDAVMGQWVRS